MGGSFGGYSALQASIVARTSLRPQGLSASMISDCCIPKVMLEGVFLAFVISRRQRRVKLSLERTRLCSGG